MIETFCHELMYSDNTEDKVFYYSRLLLNLMISILAGVLSWNCNTVLGLSVLSKIFYSVFAFMFGTLYLIFYLIFRHGTCDIQKI